MSKYERLSIFLNNQSISIRRMAFRDVEEVLGFALPSSACKYPPWWANNPRHSNAWLSVGWETEKLDLAGQKVTFRRTGKRNLPNGDNSATREVTPSSDELPIADTPPVDVSMDVKWRHLGDLAQCADGHIAFPFAPTAPGLYRFRLIDDDSSRHYIGETADFSRRFRQYRKPGPSQTTNIRVNALLKEHLESGGSAKVDIIVDGVMLTISGVEIDADLRDKATRRLLENAALVAEGGTDIDTLNR